MGEQEGRLLGGRLEQPPRLAEAALHDRGRRRPAGRQAGLDVGDVGRHPGRVGGQALEQAGEALGTVDALETGEVADESLRPAVLVDGLELPEAQLMGLAEPA